MIDNVNVILADLPTKVKAFTSKNEYGDYLIIVNAKLDETQRKKAFLHEVNHIENGHFDGEFIVSEIEFNMKRSIQ